MFEFKVELDIFPSFTKFLSQTPIELSQKRLFSIHQKSKTTETFTRAQTKIEMISRGRPFPLYKALDRSIPWARLFTRISRKETRCQYTQSSIPGSKRGDF